MLHLKKSFTSFPFLARYLNTISCKTFAIYTNESLKQKFEQQLKEKYIAQDENDDNPATEVIDTMRNGLKETYKEIFDQAEEEESVLKAMRDESYLHAMPLEMKEQREQYAKSILAAEGHFRGISTSEFMKRSKKLMEVARNNQVWDPTIEKRNKISEEYQDYDKYKKNFAKVRDVVKTPEQEDLNSFHWGKNLFRFINDLDSNMAEKKTMTGLYDSVAEEEGDPEERKREIEEDWTLTDGVDPEDFASLKPEEHEINLGEDDQPLPAAFYGRVSPWAKEEMYKLYKEGWTVRDLSIRYGLLPERVKVIIWNRQYFYDEVLPNVDMTIIMMGFEREMLYGMQFGWVDYGLDMKELSERDRGVFFTRFRRTEIDANPPKEVREKMEKVLEKKSKRKHEIVTENFVGHRHKGFFIKSWIVNKNHGSERVNRKFKMAVEQTKNPQLMPDKVRAKLDKGPRVASKGWGIKA